jgi:Multidrug resistance efflux pump
VQRHGLVSDPVLLQQQLTVAQVKNTLEDLKSQKAAILQQLRGMQQSAHMDRITARSQMDATRQQLHDLQQNILTLQGDNTALIRANHSGVVSSCAIYPGEEVLAGAPLLSLMGKNGAVEAHLLVPSTVIPYLQRGTRVLIRYHAFPYQVFGLFHGTVQSMSKSALTPPEILSLTQQRVPKPMYLVKVSLQRHIIKLPHRQFVLRPGMKLNAIIALRTFKIVPMALHAFCRARPSSPFLLVNMLWIFDLYVIF